MRKFLIPILMASAALPSAAFAQDSDRFADRRAERAEQRQERAQQREERAQQREERRRDSSSSTQSTQSSSGGGETARPARQWQGDGSDAPRMERRRPTLEGAGDMGERRFERRPRPEMPTGTVQADPVRPAPSAPATSQTDRDRGGFDQLRDRILRDGKRVESRRDGRHRDWRRDWRYDHRYDWRRHRDRNRWVFRIGTYYDPYRYNYRRFNIGYNLWPSYYSSRYWLNDPWQYRLPPVYGPYRWVRYYDDALLVNIYTGQVVDVIYSFFW